MHSSLPQQGTATLLMILERRGGIQSDSDNTMKCRVQGPDKAPLRDVACTTGHKCMKQALARVFLSVHRLATNVSAAKHQQDSEHRERSRTITRASCGNYCGELQ